MEMEEDVLVSKLEPKGKDPKMAKTVLISVDDNRGYNPEQVETEVTLGELIAQLQEAAERFGDDAKVVLSNGQQYGAGFGRFATAGWHGGDLIIGDAEPDAEEDDDLL